MVIAANQLLNCGLKRSERRRCRRWRGGEICCEVVHKYSPASGQIKAFPNPSPNSLTRRAWDFLHRRLCRSTGDSQSSGEPEKKSALSLFTSFSRGARVWLWENHKHDSPLVPWFIYFLPLSWMELRSVLIYQPDVFPCCCVEMFSRSSSWISKAPKRFPPAEGIKKHVNVCLLRGSYTIKVDLTLGGVNICYFCRDTCSRWLVELTASNENVAALCSRSKCFIWASSLLAHNPQPVVTALKPSVLLYVEIGRAVPQSWWLEGEVKVHSNAGGSWNFYSEISLKPLVNLQQTVFF